MAICDHQRCKRTAEVAPKLVVPVAVGESFNPRYNIAIVLGLKLCRRCCFGIVAAKQAALDDVAAFIRNAAKIQAKQLGLPYREPDFARAKIEAVKLSSQQYRQVAPKLEGLTGS